MLELASNARSAFESRAALERLCTGFGDISVTRAGWGRCFAFSRSWPGAAAKYLPPGCVALPHRATYAGRLFEPRATAALVGIVESVCLRELQLHLDDGRALVGVQTEIHHVGTAVAGVALFVHGRAEPAGENETMFEIFVDDPHDRVATARLLVFASAPPGSERNRQ